jgi:CII-binding regulator of phage lambda lysogenization HflD
VVSAHELPSERHKDLSKTTQLSCTVMHQISEMKKPILVTSPASWAEEFIKLLEPRQNVKEATLSAATTAAATSSVATLIAKFATQLGSIPYLVEFIFKAIIFCILMLIVIPMVARLTCEIMCQSKHQLSLKKRLTAHPPNGIAKVILKVQFPVPMRLGWDIGGCIAGVMMYLPDLHREMMALRKMITKLTKKANDCRVVRQAEKITARWNCLLAEIVALKAEQSLRTSQDRKLIEALQQAAIGPIYKTDAIITQMNHLVAWEDQMSLWSTGLEQKVSFNSKTIAKVQAIIKVVEKVQENMLKVEKNVRDRFIWQQEKQSTAAKDLDSYKSTTGKIIRSLETNQKRLDIMTECLFETIKEEKQEEKERFEKIGNALDKMTMGDVAPKLIANTFDQLARVIQATHQVLAKQIFEGDEKMVNFIEELCLILNKSVDTNANAFERIGKNIAEIEKKTKSLDNFYFKLGARIEELYEDVQEQFRELAGGSDQLLDNFGEQAENLDRLIALEDGFVTFDVHSDEKTLAEVAVLEKIQREIFIQPITENKSEKVLEEEFEKVETHVELEVEKRMI